MRHICRLIILFCLLFSSSTYAAYEIFLAPLYWRATETFDWLHESNRTTPNLVVSFKAVGYDFSPGIRFGASYEGDWYTKLYFTTYYTQATDSASGNLTTGFLGTRLTQTVPLTYYQTAQADFSIHFNMLDWNLGKRIDATNTLMIRPYIGLEGGTIYQTFNTYFQNSTSSAAEQITNNFNGVGPKIGVETNLIFLQLNNYQYSLVANLESSYLWGRWSIHDQTQTSNSSTILIQVANRNFGAVGIQGMIGAGITQKNFSMKLSYEISDWLNQCQFFNDETGTQNGDLLLQGLTLSLSYRF